MIVCLFNSQTHSYHSGPTWWSYVTYENIETTFKMTSSSYSNHESHEFGSTLKAHVGTDQTFATGACVPIGFDIEIDVDSIEIDVAANIFKEEEEEEEDGEELVNDKFELSNLFSTMGSLPIRLKSTPKNRPLCRVLQTK